MMDNYQRAVKIYENGGQYAVYDAVNAGILRCKTWSYCLACEDVTPVEHDNGCLVCGSKTGANDGNT